MMKWQNKHENWIIEFNMQKYIYILKKKSFQSIEIYCQTKNLNALIWQNQQQIYHATLKLASHNNISK